jgi:hypothetical protein
MLRVDYQHSLPAVAVVARQIAITPSTTRGLFGVRWLDSALLGRGSTRQRAAGPSAAASSLSLLLYVGGFGRAVLFQFGAIT